MTTQDKGNNALNLRRASIIPTPVKTVILMMFLLFTSGCALGPPTYEINVKSAVTGRGHVSVRREGDVAILSGWVEDRYSYNAVHRVARAGEGIKHVVSRVQIAD